MIATTKKTSVEVFKGLGHKLQQAQMRFSSFTRPQKAAIVAKYRAGVTIKQIACDYGIGKAAVHHTLDEAGMQHRGGEPTPPTELEIAEATAKLRETWSEREHRRRAGLSSRCHVIEWHQPIRRAGNRMLDDYSATDEW